MKKDFKTTLYMCLLMHSLVSFYLHQKLEFKFYKTTIYYLLGRLIKTYIRSTITYKF